MYVCLFKDLNLTYLNECNYYNYYNYYNLVIFD